MISRDLEAPKDRGTATSTAERIGGDTWGKTGTWEFVVGKKAFFKDRPKCDWYK